MSKPQYFFVLAGILMLAAFFRLYRLSELPPGLHYDEAFNAVQAQHVLSGAERPIYFTGDLTEEPMAIYAAALFFWLFGTSPFTLRLVSAFVGILTVAAICFLARTMTPFPASRRTGMLAALILSILYWQIDFSRLGMELIFLPLMLTLGMGFLLRAIRPHSLSRLGERNGREALEWALAGFFFALSQYTYKAALFVPILVSTFLASESMIDHGFISRNRRGLEILLGVAVLVFAPLGLYWAAHPSEFIERPSTVLTAPAAYLQNAVQVGAMFFLRGDANPRSNLPGRPALDPVLAIGFIAGVGVSLARLKRVESRTLLIWLGVMVLPSILTDFAPHFGRSIAATPALALFTAFGFSEIFPRLERLFANILKSQMFARRAIVSLCILLFTFSAISTFRDYFIVWASDPGRFYSFDVGLLSLAQKLRARPANETLFLTPAASDHYTIQFGLAGGDANSFDGSKALVLPEPGSAMAYGIITRSDTRSLARLEKIYPDGRVVDRISDFVGQPYAVIFRAEGAGQWSPQKRIGAQLGDHIALIGYDISRNGSEVALTIYWGCIAEMHEDETVFIHALDAAGRVIAQTDNRPGQGSYVTTQWRAGQVIVDDYRLTLPPGSRGDFQIEIGMYDLQTGVRVRVTDANGAHMENDRVLVERLTFP